MTDLRRTAQMIDDLHMLGVLEKSDSIGWSNTDKCGIIISINLQPEKLDGSIDLRIQTIQKAIQEEFSEKNPYFLPDTKGSIICSLGKKE